MENHTVTSDNYALHATRTERIISTSDTIPAETAFVLALSLQAVSDLGDQLDRLKRLVFYDQAQDVRDILTRLPDCKLERAVGPTTLTPEQHRLLHAAMGLVTEAIEFSESVAAHIFQGKSFDAVHAKEELGDIFWYSAIPVNLYSWTYKDIMAVNIAKLKARYPGKWTQEEALNRDLQVERQILEEGPKAQSPGS